MSRDVSEILKGLHMVNGLDDETPDENARMIKMNGSGILADFEIENLCQGDRPMISPFHMGKVKEEKNEDGTVKKVVSYGCSEFGYDIRLSTKVTLCVKDTYASLDPKQSIAEDWLDADLEIDTSNSFYVMKPGSILLVQTVERFIMPDDVVGIVYDKSTYSRLGLLVPSAVLEPGWEGILTLCLHNASLHPVRIYPNEGIAQIIFYRGSKPFTGYGDGKYQKQSGVTLAKV